MKYNEEDQFIFPVEKLTTRYEWDDLIVMEKTSDDIKKIESWLKKRNQLKKAGIIPSDVRAGFRAIFYGASGTGKTFTASLLGKKTGHDVYCINLSDVITKYIGETEKNLAKLFDRAEKSDWILVFDEADALFGKRTGIKDSHDRYANQEISYLLQRIDSCSVLVILAFNSQLNLDLLFFKRFNLVVEFELPDAEQRLILWKKFLPLPAVSRNKIGVNEIARKYELTPGQIINAIRFAGDEQQLKNFKVNLVKGIKKEIDEQD